MFQVEIWSIEILFKDDLKKYILIWATQRWSQRCKDTSSYRYDGNIDDNNTSPRWTQWLYVDMLIWMFPKIGGKNPTWMVKIMVPSPMNKWMIWGFLIFLETPSLFMQICPRWVPVLQGAKIFRVWRSLMWTKTNQFSNKNFSSKFESSHTVCWQSATRDLVF